MTTVLARDTFTGYTAPPTSGACDFPGIGEDDTFRSFRADFRGSATAGDKCEFTLTFPGGTVTFRAEWTDSDTLVLSRISTIAGTNNGTATLRTFTGSSTSKPRSTGDLIRMGIGVNRGASDGSTAISFYWHGRSGTGSTDQTTDTFNIDGELTATAGAFAITGSSFTNRPSLEGRVPDGGGDPTKAVGNWHQVYGVDGDKLFPAEMMGVDADEILRPQMASFGDQLYVLRSTGAAGDQTARLWATCTAGRFPSFILATRVTGNIYDFTLCGYLLFGFYEGDSVDVWLYRFDNGSPTFLDGVTISPLADGTEFEFELSSIADLHTITVNGSVAFSATDATYAVGDGGVGGYRDGRDLAGIDITAWEIEAAGGSTACAIEISRDDFNTTIADVDTDVMTNGVMAKHPASVASLTASGGLARVLGSGRAIYLGKSITGLTNDYCVETRGRFRERSAPSGRYAWVPVWTDSFVGAAGTPLAGRAHDGGSAGVGTWTRADSGDSSGDDAVLDGEGRVHQVAPGSPATGSFLCAYGLTGLTLGTHIRVEIDVYNDGTLGSPDDTFPDGRPSGLVGTTFRFQGAMGPGDTLYERMWWWDTRVTRTYPNDFHARTGPITGGLGGSLAGGQTIPDFGTRTYRSEIQGTGADPAVIGVVCNDVPAITFYDGQFTARENLDTGGPGLMWAGQVAGINNALRVSEFRIYELVFIAPSYAYEDAVLCPLVRYDETADSGYRLRAHVDYTDPLGVGLVSTIDLLCMDAGTPTVMRTYAVGLGFETLESLLLRVQGTVLAVVINGVEEGTFDVATDTADETAATVTNYTTGFPGIDAEDASGTGDFLDIDVIIVYGQTADIPCTGGSDNGYPYTPPPFPPVTDYPPFAWVMDHLAWQAFPWPTDEWPSDAFNVKDNLITKAGLGGYVRDNLDWRIPIGDFGDQPPPSDSPFPPYWDPCGILPPVDPPGEVTLDPITSRFIFLGNMPISVCGPLWNGAKLALGWWTAGDLAAAAAKGVSIVTGQGGYKQYQVANQWNKAQFIARHLEILSSVYGTLSTAPNYFGHNLSDDTLYPPLWPPRGTPLDELVDAVNTIRAAYPLIRYGIRLQPTKLPPDVGAVFDFFHAQYGAEKGTSGKSATQFATEEYGRAVSWGKYCFLDLNYAHGGNHSSGVQVFNGTFLSGKYACSAAEALSYVSDMLDVANAIDGAAKLPGTGGYTYCTEVMSIPGMMSTIALLRNKLAALPPP